MDLPKQFDNITSRVIDDLKITLQRGFKVSMAAASFYIRFRGITEGVGEGGRIAIYLHLTYIQQGAGKKAEERVLYPETQP